MSFDGKTIKLSDTVKLLGLTLNKNATYKQHMQNICHKAINKTRAVQKISMPLASASISRSVYFINF